MYLTRINKISGLLMVEDDLDGFYAVPAFRKVLESKDGLEKLTVVALVVDYLTPYRFYSQKERPLKAMDVVFNSRKKMLWTSDDIQAAAIAYGELQKSIDLEEEKMLSQLRLDKLNEINAEEDANEKIKKIRELDNIKTMIANFTKKNDGKDLYQSSPVRNGYKLSRLEQLIDNKNSFYHVKPTTT